MRGIFTHSSPSVLAHTFIRLKSTPPHTRSPTQQTPINHLRPCREAMLCQVSGTLAYTSNASVTTLMASNITILPSNCSSLFGGKLQSWASHRCVLITRHDAWHIKFNKFLLNLNCKASFSCTDATLTKQPFDNLTSLVAAMDGGNACSNRCECLCHMTGHLFLAGN